ncbi:hypothetical protein ACFV7R_14665 [Streptomyces sp. NPDC059866]|uniref:hypothetical protein n=1 Tax=Streptomyces sp. NPDC059866 TaxID=3346978 RepID=UPI003665CA52
MSGARTLYLSTGNQVQWVLDFSQYAGKDEDGLFRDGNEIYGYLPLFADGKTHAGSSDFASVATTLYQGGTKVGANDDPLFGDKTFKVPSGDAAYQLTTSARRSAKVAAATTRIDASWTFRSAYYGK